MYESKDAVCDLKDGVTPNLWRTRADGILQLSGPPMWDQLRAMDDVLVRARGMSNVRVVWLDRFRVNVQGEVDKEFLAETFEFLLDGSRSEFHGGSDIDILSREVADRAARRVVKSVGQGGVGGRHIHSSSERRETIAAIEDLALHHEHVQRYVALRRKWRQERARQEGRSESGEAERSEL